MNRYLTEQLKAFVLSEGMDLVGFGPVERWSEAPFLLSPQAILPGCKTVIVGAIHITDTWTEMGGEPTPQDLGPGGWMDQNSLLDRVGYHTARFLMDSGYKAIPIASSNIWRYRDFENIPSLFAPDLSHMHAAVAAGLGEMVWTGLTSTPEFGPRVRFISIVTDAELVPTPMYNGPELCDKCMDCVKCCPSYAMEKDMNGKPHTVNIGGKTYKYANKNIWRCAWAEHFSLDLDSQTLEKDHINEEMVIDEVNEKGVRGHERGVCQKICIPPHLRTEAPSFGRENKRIAMKRINKRYDENMPTLRKMRDDIIAKAIQWGADYLGVGTIDTNSKYFEMIEKQAPGMKTAICVVIQIPEIYNQNKDLDDYTQPVYDYTVHTKTHQLLLRIAKEVENYGYHASSYGTLFDSDTRDPGLIYEFAEHIGLGKVQDGKFITPEFGENVWMGIVTTDAPLDSTPKGENLERVNFGQTRLSPKMQKNKLAVLAQKNYVSSFGVASAGIFDNIVEDIKANINNEDVKYGIIDVSGTLHGKWKSKIVDNGNRIRKPSDYLPNAKSIISLGMHFGHELISNTGLDTTKQIGTYAFWNYQTYYELCFAAFEVSMQLERWGYKTVMTSNMLGIGSMVDTPRLYQPDMRCGAVEAAAAGLGVIGKNGVLLTEEYGPHQRFITIITDAKLPADAVKSNNIVCDDCDICISKCLMQANTGEFFDIHIGDNAIKYPKLQHNRCDWAKRYSLNPETGPALIGNDTQISTPHDGELTLQELADACEQKDMVMKKRTCILEPCLNKCPAYKKSV